MRAQEIGPPGTPRKPQQWTTLYGEGCPEPERDWLPEGVQRGRGQERGRDPRVTRWSREKPSAPQVCFRGERPAEEGGPEREGSGKRRGLKSALRDTKFVLFCARRSSPSVPEPESEFLSLLDS